MKTEELALALARAEARIAALERVAADDPLRIILENLPAYVARLTPEGDYLYLNRFAPGFTQADIEGKSIFSLIDPRDHAAVHEALATVRRTKAPAGHSFVAPGAHGKATRYYQVFAPQMEGDEIVSLVVVATDISPVVEATAALEESEAKLRIAAAASRIGFWTFDPEDPAASSADERTLELMGATREMSAADRFALIHRDDLARVEAALAEALRTDSAYGPVELRVLGANHVERWLEGRGSVVRGLDAKRRIVGSVVDITERKRMEERNAQDLKMQSIGRLAGGVAHDFNNMLAAILGFAELAQRSLPPGAAHTAIEEICRAAERSADVTRRLLAFARKQTIAVSPIDVNELVRQMEPTLRTIIGGDVRIMTDLRATRPISVDRGQFEHLLVNLATNARDAMPSGGRLTIGTADATLDAHEVRTLALHPPRSTVVRLWVTDEGHGIAAEHLGMVFEPFFTTKRVGEGTGLGLAIVYGVVTAHGGHIAVESQKGRGTTFRITLPIAPEERVERRDAVGERSITRRSHARILVAEDQPQVRAFIATALREEGYEVIETEDGREAIAAASDPSLSIDLVLTDLVMPHVGGREVVATLRAARPELPAIYVSGYSEESDVAQDDPKRSRFLAKPFRIADLLDQVSLLLDVASPRQAD